MRKLVCTALSILFAFSLTAAAQSKSASAPDAAWMQKVWDAWNTLDPANAAQYYDDKSPGNVYFDLAPLQYKGWDAYAAGVKDILGAYQSLNCRLAEPAVHASGDWAWGTALAHCDAVTKDGAKAPTDFRYTGVFHKKAGKWLIVHEHVSAPLPQ